MNSSIRKLCGPFQGAYDEIYKRINPNNYELVNREVVLQVMRTSILRPDQLSKIWNLVLYARDHTMYLNKLQIYRILKLLAAHQNNLPIASSSLDLTILPPTCLNLLTEQQELQFGFPTAMMSNYSVQFLKLSNHSPLINGTAVRDYLVADFRQNSALLSQLWKLVDMDGDGLIDELEFIAFNCMLFSLKSGKLTDVPAVIPYKMLQMIRLCPNMPPRRLSDLGVFKDFPKIKYVPPITNVNNNVNRKNSFINPPIVNPRQMLSTSERRNTVNNPTFATSQQLHQNRGSFGQPLNTNKERPHTTHNNINADYENNQRSVVPQMDSRNSYGPQIINRNSMNYSNSVDVGIKNSVDLQPQTALPHSAYNIYSSQNSRNDNSSFTPPLQGIGVRRFEAIKQKKYSHSNENEDDVSGIVNNKSNVSSQSDSHVPILTAQDKRAIFSQNSSVTSIEMQIEQEIAMFDPTRGDGSLKSNIDFGVLVTRPRLMKLFFMRFKPDPFSNCIKFENLTTLMQMSNLTSGQVEFVWKSMNLIPNSQINYETFSRFVFSIYRQMSQRQNLSTGSMDNYIGPGESLTQINEKIKKMNEEINLFSFKYEALKLQNESLIVKVEKLEKQNETLEYENQKKTYENQETKEMLTILNTRLSVPDKKTTKEDFVKNSDNSGEYKEKFNKIMEQLDMHEDRLGRLEKEMKNSFDSLMDSGRLKDGTNYVNAMIKEYSRGSPEFSENQSGHRSTEISDMSQLSLNEASPAANETEFGKNAKTHVIPSLNFEHINLNTKPTTTIDQFNTNSTPTMDKIVNIQTSSFELSKSANSLAASNRSTKMGNMNDSNDSSISCQNQKSWINITTSSNLNIDSDYKSSASFTGDKNEFSYSITDLQATRNEAHIKNKPYLYLDEYKSDDSFRSITEQTKPISINNVTIQDNAVKFESANSPYNHSLFIDNKESKENLFDTKAGLGISISNIANRTKSEESVLGSKLDTVKLEMSEEMNKSSDVYFDTACGPNTLHSDCSPVRSRKPGSPISKDKNDIWSIPLQNSSSINDKIWRLNSSSPAINRSPPKVSNTTTNQNKDLSENKSNNTNIDPFNINNTASNNNGDMNSNDRSISISGLTTNDFKSNKLDKLNQNGKIMIDNTISNTLNVSNNNNKNKTLNSDPFNVSNSSFVSAIDPFSIRENNSNSPFTNKNANNLIDNSRETTTGNNVHQIDGINEFTDNNQLKGVNNIQYSSNDFEYSRQSIIQVDPFENFTNDINFNDTKGNVDPFAMVDHLAPAFPKDQNSTDWNQQNSP